MVSIESAWNLRHLQPPLAATVQIEVNSNTPVLVKNVLSTLSNAVDVLQDQHILASESFILSRLMSNRKNQIRRHPVRKTLTQVDACLKRHLEVNLPSIFTSLCDAFKQTKTAQETGGVVYIPGQAAVQYILVKLMGNAALLAQTVNYCVAAATTLYCDVRLAHLLPRTVLYIATVSRIWAFCRSLYLDCVSWYGELLPLVSVLPFDIHWLAPGSALPENLPTWLGHRISLDNMTRAVMTYSDDDSSFLSSYYTVPGDTGDDTMAETPDVDGKEINKPPSPERPPPTVSGMHVEEDIGEPVTLSDTDMVTFSESADDTATKIENEPKKKKKRKKQSTNGDINENSINISDSEDNSMSFQSKSNTEKKTKPSTRFDLACMIKGKIRRRTTTFEKLVELFTVLDPIMKAPEKVSVFERVCPSRKNIAGYRTTLAIVKNLQDQAQSSDEYMYRKLFKRARMKCIKYLKEIEHMNIHRQQPMMTPLLLASYVVTLDASRLTWEGKPVELSPKKAHVLQGHLKRIQKLVQEARSKSAWTKLMKKAHSYIQLCVEDIKSNMHEMKDESDVPMQDMRKEKKKKLKDKKMKSGDERTEDSEGENLPNMSQFSTQHLDNSLNHEENIERESKKKQSKLMKDRKKEKKKMKKMYKLNSGKPVLKNSTQQFRASKKMKHGH